MTDFKQLLLKQNPKYKRLESIQSTIERQSKGASTVDLAKRAVLNSFDTLISLIVISPLVIGNWRGTWVLMDLHNEYFPPYESWLFCCGLHIAFMLLRNIFRDCSKEQRKKYQRHLFFQIWRRIYITAFAESIIMMWRGGWLVYDGWCGVTMVDAMRAGCYDGTKINDSVVGCEYVTVYEAPNIKAYNGTNNGFHPCPCATNDKIIWISLLIMVFMLGVLKSIRNNLAVPFIIAVDSETSAFVFPTRFRTEISSVSFHVLNPYSKPMHVSSENTTVVEEPILDNETLTMDETQGSKLISMNSLQENIGQRRKSPPRPFLNGPYDGPAPSSFSPGISPYNRNVPKENWAQLSNYKSPQNHPKNIQEILNYVTTNEKLESDSSVVIQKPVMETFKPDPFFNFRPNEPSDINLLATASFKFAPPIWKNLRASRKPTMTKGPVTLHGPAPSFTLPGSKRPLTVTLNVFPMQGAGLNSAPIGPFLTESESVQRQTYTTPPGILQKIKTSYNSLFDRREKLMPLPKTYLPNKMIIHLNLFPDEDIYKSLSFAQRMDKSVEV